MTIPSLNFKPQQESNLELEIIDLEALYKRLPKLNHDPFQPHRLRFHHFICFSKGSGSHFIDFDQYSYQPGSFIFIGKNQVHAFDRNDKPQGRMILFTQDFLDQLNTNVRVPFFISNLMSSHLPIINCEGRLKNSCEVIINEIEDELNDADCNSLIVQFLFSTLLLKLIREKPVSYYDETLSHQQAIKFAEFMQYVEENFSTSRDATAYAKSMNMTYKSLNQICKLGSNQTPKQLIDAHLILEAKRRLVIDKTSTNQLAYELGFDEASNFTKYFKKHTHVTPAQFKADHVSS